MAVGLVRLGLSGVPRVNKTAPKIIRAGGLGTAFAVGLGVSFGSGAGSCLDALGSASGVGAALSTSAAGFAYGVGQARGITRIYVTRLGSNALPRAVRQSNFTGVSSKSWIVNTVAALGATVDQINGFTVQYRAFANIAASAIGQPRIAGFSYGTSTVTGRAGFIGTSVGQSTVLGASTAVSNLFGVGVGVASGVGTAVALGPNATIGLAGGVAYAYAEGLGLGTIPALGSANGISSVDGIGFYSTPTLATTFGIAQGVGWAQGYPSFDNTAPIAPTSIMATNITANSVTLIWGLSTDTGGSGLAGYNIGRNGSKLNSFPLTDLVYIDTNLVSGETYSYTVSAIDNQGNESMANPSVSVTTLEDTSTLTTVVINNPLRKWDRA